MLNVSNLTLRYGQSQVLHGVDLTAEAGQVTALMGVNGVGKTSLLKAIAGRHPYTDGTIALEGRELNHLSAVAVAKAGIAYVPQGREVFPLMTVEDNLRTGFACLGREHRRIPDQIYDLFPVLAKMKGRRGGDLSGGQQQQLAIGRALICQPKVLLLDEPTEGIQPSIIKDVGRVIRTIRDEGQIAVVLVEQFFDFAVDLADRVTTLSNGIVSYSTESVREDVESIRRSVAL